ncbi:MAG: site-specific integrase [SAR324 cluster bacterium]|nr:site-specific integrase [SAR324 cluster bacterium]
MTIPWLFAVSSLLSNEELDKLYSAERYASKRSQTISSIDEMVKCLLFTGARIGEVLHIELPDLDLNMGIWHIKFKPECPTKHGKGWKPRWGKGRTIFLIPEAIELLRSIPIHESIGIIPIMNDDIEVVGKEMVEAQFVFPKKKRVDNGSRLVYSRNDNIYNSWATLKRNAGIENLQLKDLRTYFNHFLKSECGFTSKEAVHILAIVKKSITYTIHR